MKSMNNELNNDLICITVSTKYDDILNIIIPQNYKFFKIWYIITESTDIKTINIINKYNYPNIKIVFFDFTKNNKIFNKGGGLKYCQQLIDPNYDGLVLLLDSDIYLPNNLLNIIKNTDIQPDILYSSTDRILYISNRDFILNRPYKILKNDFYGFFQLYKYNKEFLCIDSNDCGVSDIHFRDTYFKNKIILKNLDIKHFGRDIVNWKGRNKKDFVI